MTRSLLPRWRLLVTLIMLLATLSSVARTTPAMAQQTPFRLTHVVDKGAQAQVTITGRVFNDARADAIDVYVAAEALDAGGKVVASGVSYVGSVPAGSSTAFVLKVPSARAAANFRVIVSSYKFGFALQS